MTSFISLLIEISRKILLLNLWLLCDYWLATHNLPTDIHIIKIYKILIIKPLSPDPQMHNMRWNGQYEYLQDVITLLTN